MKKHQPVMAGKNEWNREKRELCGESKLEVPLW